jgi:hypothetical protein
MRKVQLQFSFLVAVVAKGAVPHCHSTFDVIPDSLLFFCMLLPARVAHVLPPSGFMNFARNYWTEKRVIARPYPTQYKADKVSLLVVDQNASCL